MAISIQAQVAKKVPIPGTDFASQQASITVTAEVADFHAIPQEAARLHAVAEQAVDCQLGLLPRNSAAPQASPRPIPPLQSAPPPSSASTRGGPRRALAPVTDSQLRFIDRLVRETGIDPAAMLAHHQVGSLRDLSCRAAAQVIDELKAHGAREGR